MISSEQKHLSDYVKSVHLSLRCRSQQIGAENAWKEHLEKEEILKVYAECMKSLAENFWAVNNETESDKCLCRIQWMVNFITEYFERGNYKMETEKEFRKIEYFIEKKLLDSESYGNVSLDFNKPFKLLDVGSCYDPFGSFNLFETFPIDLYPAVPQVKKCNFIEAEIEQFKIQSEPDWFSSVVKKIPVSFFDVVIFSLFLEYLPSPQQRFMCCQKAYDCLKLGGILLIATPDSKHESANSSIMKSWKIALSAIGFTRIKLEKLKYMYCMAFRKAISKNYPAVLYNVSAIENFKPNEMIIIPQDSVNYSVKEEKLEKLIGDENVTKEVFKELPFSS